MDNSIMRLGALLDKRNGHPVAFIPALNIFMQIPERVQTCLKAHFTQLIDSKRKTDDVSFALSKKKELRTELDICLEKQLHAWKENPAWVDEPPQIKVSVPKGSLCNLNMKFKAGLPPDAIYDIVIDPDNKRVFKNIKEVISRNVLLDDGMRQIVEVEQAAIWRFLWWSGTISVHVIVDQNRKDHSVRFKQGKSGFMKRFEGCWKVEPFFVDEQLCSPYRPETWADYDVCTRGKGRVGSIVSLEQLVQPALIPPPPISWYLRGITSKTTEMLINDLLAETARIRGAAGYNSLSPENLSNGSTDESSGYNLIDIKERWRRRRKNLPRRKLTVNSV